MANNSKNTGKKGGGWVAPIVLCFIPPLMWVGIIWLIIKGLSSVGDFYKANQDSIKNIGKPAESASAQSPVKSAAAETASEASAQPKKTENTSIARVIKNAFSRVLNRARGMSVLFGFFAFCLLIAGISVFTAIPNAASGFSNIFGSLITAAGLTGAAFGFGGLCARSVLRRGRYRRYQAVLGGEDIVRIDNICRATGYDEKQVVRDLQRIIDGGHFGGRTVYIDRKYKLLVLNQNAHQKYREAIGDEIPGAEDAARAAPIPDAAETKKQVDEYERILISLQKLDDAIADESISNKIQQIKQTSANIFDVVKATPSKLPQIRKLMSYYLPTTMKLLEQYARFEQQRVSGENVDKAKQDIDRVLATLAEGFQRQLDNLYASDALDIAADITVLENMMARDGLSGTGFTVR